MPSPVKVGEWENIDDGLSLTFLNRLEMAVKTWDFLNWNLFSRKESEKSSSQLLPTLVKYPRNLMTSFQGEILVFQTEFIVFCLMMKLGNAAIIINFLHGKMRCFANQLPLLSNRFHSLMLCYSFNSSSWCIVYVQNCLWHFMLWNPSMITLNGWFFRGFQIRFPVRCKWIREVQSIKDFMTWILTPEGSDLLQVRKSSMVLCRHRARSFSNGARHLVHDFMQKTVLQKA